MTATLPDGMEYKNLTAACIDAPGVWGSQFPEEDGVRNLIVAVTGVRDEVGDIIVPGAFAHTLQRIEPKGCMGHDWNRVTGYPEAIEEVMPGDPRLPKTDRHGRPWPAEAGALFVRHRYHTDTDDGQRAYKDARFLGPRLACSIGYVDPKDDNGKPLHSYKKIDPASGLMTRFLPRLDLFEYSQVLHGAHLLAGGLKDGKPKRLERKARPSMELKVRLVRDAQYWGMPLGTPIRPGMKPQGPKARRVAAAGQPIDENAGAVEIDANNLRVKPTAKGKKKGPVAISEAYDGIATLIDRLGEHTGEDSEPLTPFNTTGFVVEDSFDNSINNGEDYNPLDILVANAETPADVEEQLLNNTDWDSDRLGDAAERQNEIDNYVADVVDAYREKYNAELVRQNDTGDGEVPDTSAEDTEVQPDSAEDAPEQAPAAAPAGQPAAAPEPQSSRPTTEEWQAAQSDMAAAGVEPQRTPAPGLEDGRPSVPPAEEPVAMPSDFDSTGKPQRGFAIPPPPAASAASASPVGDLPEMAVHNGDPVNIRAVDGDTANVYNTRTEQAYDVPVGELLTGGAAVDAPAPVKLNDVQRDAADLAFGNDEPADVSGAEITRDGLSVVNIAEALATIDTRFEAFEDNPDQKRRHGRALKAVRAKIAKLAKPAEDAATPGAADESVGKFPDGTKPTKGLIAALGNATWVTGEKLGREEGNQPADGWLVTGHGNTIFTLYKKKVAYGVSRGSNHYLLTEEGARLMAPYLPNGGKREGDQTAPDGTPEALQDNGDGMSEPSTEVVPEQPSGQSGVDGPDLTGLPEDQLIEQLYHGPDSAAAQREYDRRFGTPEGGTPEDGIAGNGADTASEGAVGEPLGETDPALAEPELTGSELTEPGMGQPAPEEEITPDELADTDESIDASFGVTEAPDGEFEVDADIADRQDRVASLLAQSETGGLDLSGNSDDQLRGTRADVVDELRLQQHLERRRASERAVTRQQAETQAVEDLVPQEDDDTGGTPATPEETGPKPRPGVAGAAEDYADALEANDPGRADAARARLDSALRRSRSDSEVVAELRDLAASQELSPTILRDIVERLREEQRAKRNEGARRRRAARRFERERLRSLLGQIEAEMRNRNLDYDPLPGDDGNVTLDLGASTPVTWTSRNHHEDWSGFDTRIEELSGANYQATVSTRQALGSIAAKNPEYSWSVTSDDGVVLASGSGTATDADSARATVEIALDTQRRLGLIPIDAQVPQGSVPQHTSAAPLADVVDAVQGMRQRIADGRRVNPITGSPDPFGETLEPLAVPERSRFSDTGQVRKYLESHGVTTRSGAGESRNVVDTYRWDTAKMTPGGAFVVVDDLKGKPQVVHTVSGATFPPPLIGKSGLGRADLFRYATIAESIRDTDGKLVDWNLSGREVTASLKGRSFTSGGDQDGGRGDVRAAVLDRLTREKIHAGQFTHALVQRDFAFVDGVTNESRKQFVHDQHRTLAQLINVARGKPDTFDKKTLNTASGARTLAAMGAPDAAAVLLTRRATEIREQHADNAASRGAAVLDALARGYLGMFSPVRSHGERVRALKAGEQLFLAEPDSDAVRSFRVLAAGRRDPRGAPSDQIVPVIDEKNGEQRFLHVGISQFRIEESEDRSYGYTPLSGDLGNGLYVVAGPGEEPPATVEDLKARAFDDADVIPQDVLDAAAEVLPESAGETAARRATPTDGVRPPRRRSPAAPKRTAQALVAPEPVAGEQHLAEAQGRIEGAFLGMPFSYGEQPQRGNFDDLDEVREHLVALEVGAADPRVASSARALLADLDGGGLKLSPGGVFLIRKGGSVMHASTGFSVWPPSTQGARAILDDLAGGGYTFTQAAGLRVARALESGVFDGEQIDWSGDGRKAIKQTNVISNRNGKFHPIWTAQRAAYLDGVLNSPKPTKSDIATFRGMADQVDLEGPNPEAFDWITLLSLSSEYGSGMYAPDSKKGVTTAGRVETELRLTQSLAKTAPLDAVRRLTRLADELDGEKIEMRLNVSTAQFGAGAEPDKRKTLIPSEDLRKAATMITDTFDPNKISESGRFRAAGMVGQVEITKPKITMGRTWEDPNGIAGRRLEAAIKEGGGIRFYRDENGLLHATFTASETGVAVDIAEGNFPANGTQVGAIKLAPDGRLTLSYVSANRLIVIEGAPGAWKFTPEETGNADSDADISGAEIESAQAGDDSETDTPGDTAGDAGAVNAEKSIRQVYKQLADGPQDWVRLALLRARLGHVDRAEVDAALLQMTRTGLVHLVPDSNRKVLTEEDHAAAIRIGDEDKHLIAIEEE